MDEHSTDKESTERRPGEERKENRGEENGFSWPALHHRHLHLQVSQQVSFGLHFNYLSYLILFFYKNNKK